MKQRVRKSGDVATTTPTTNAATHRLSEIEVDEVSIVDRAANKRSYLVVKRGAKPKVEEVEKALPPTAPAAPAAPPPPAAPSPAQGGMQISPEFKAKVLGALRAAAEKIATISQALQGAVETPGAAPPQELMDALAQLAELLHPGTPAAATPPASPAGAPPTKKEDEKDETSKAGRKISASRLKQLTAARDQLNSLINEADGGGGGDEEEEPAEKPEKDGTKKQATPASVPSAELAAMNASLAQLTATVTNVARVIETQNARIETLQKSSRGVSQQVDTESQPSRRDEPVTWEFDMAKPVAKQ